MATDGNGDLYVGGSYEGTMAKNGWSITANKGGADLFFIKEGSTPSNQWAATGGSNSADSLQGMDVSSRGELVFTSFFLDGTFSAGTKSTTGASSGWISTIDADMMLGGLTSTGGWSWLDVTSSAALDIGWDVAYNASDIAAGIGSYAGPQGSDTITKGTTSITTAGGWDNFVWAIDPSMKADTDNDGVPDVSDNCPNISNPLQGNTDGDSQGDECDSDDDNDGITDNSPDECPREVLPTGAQRRISMTRPIRPIGTVTAAKTMLKTPTWTTTASKTAWICVLAPAISLHARHGCPMKSPMWTATVAAMPMRTLTTTATDSKTK